MCSLYLYTTFIHYLCITFIHICTWQSFLHFLVGDTVAKWVGVSSLGSNWSRWGSLDPLCQGNTWHKERASGPKSQVRILHILPHSHSETIYVKWIKSNQYFLSSLKVKPYILEWANCYTCINEWLFCFVIWLIYPVCLEQMPSHDLYLLCWKLQHISHLP